MERLLVGRGLPVSMLTGATLHFDVQCETGRLLSLKFSALSTSSSLVGGDAAIRALSAKLPCIAIELSNRSAMRR